MQIVGICKQHGYVQLSVYQGIYNAIHRNVESELFPALRKFGIAFYAFTRAFRARYWKPVFFDALEEVRTVATAHGLTMRRSHSAGSHIPPSSPRIRGHGDHRRVQFKQIEENLVSLESGPLHELHVNGYLETG
ncbi:hypothetical protein B0H14DRAFT_2629587 [Mycena olivaceomarginata]|nr:hypothetical protein B0H14DRAFT_2629587 [Mycena olivaceomarginata]